MCTMGKTTMTCGCKQCSFSGKTICCFCGCCIGIKFWWEVTTMHCSEASCYNGNSTGFGGRNGWIQIPGATCCMVLGKLLDLSSCRIKKTSLRVWWRQCWKDKMMISPMSTIHKLCFYAGLLRNKCFGKATFPNTKHTHSSYTQAPTQSSLLILPLVPNLHLKKF
jgi:hypothetical protein